MLKRVQHDVIIKVMKNLLQIALKIEISLITISGMAGEYGEGGFEIRLRDSPIASEGDVWIQLLDQASLPLTEQITFQTYDSCDSNLIRINFVQQVE